MIDRPVMAIMVLGLVSLLPGCRRDPPTYPVRGRVTFPSGAVVRTGTVETRSRELGTNARGSIQPDGTFQLSTFQSNDGAVAGLHDCVVVQLVIAEGLGTAVSTLGGVDPRHNSYRTSGLTIEVLPQPLNEVRLEVSAIGGKELPERDHKH